jgi:hypothetical protein
VTDGPVDLEGTNEPGYPAERQRLSQPRRDPLPLPPIAELESTLDTLERATVREEEYAFGARLEAIEQIEFELIGALDARLEAGEDKGPLLALRQRAVALRGALEEANGRVVESLRDRIRAGSCRGAGLLDELRRYLALSPDAAGDDLAYDSFDVFAQGLIGSGPPPGEPGPDEPEMVPYQPTPARLIVDLVTRAGMGSEEVFVDIGSGLGLAAILVALLSGARVIGVEHQPAYCTYARKCAEGLGLASVEFVNQDAREADLSVGTAFYLYTPFQREMLGAVLEKLRCLAQTRAIAVWTYGPCTPVVARERWLHVTSGRAGSEHAIVGFRSL